MMLKEICKFIENHSAYVIGTTLFYGHRIQNAPDRCILVSERQDGKADEWLKDKGEKIVTIICKSSDYDQASTDANAIHDILHQAIGFDLPIVVAGDEYHLMVSLALGLPVYLGMEDHNLHEFSCNYALQIQDK